MLRHVLPTVVLVAGLLVALSLANSWRPTAPLAHAWDRYGTYVRWNVSSAPATFVYLAILWVTTWVLLGMPSQAKEAFLADQSTNLAHLTTNPIRVMIRSAFFVSISELLAWTVLFALVLAPAERWLGTGRAVAAFAIGHVGASGLTAIDIWLHVRYLHVPRSVWDDTDTGASYGFFAIAALLVFRLRGWTRWLLGISLAAVFAYGMVEGTGYTARGHALSVLIGLALFPLGRNAHVVGRTGPGRNLTDLWMRRFADGEGRGVSANVALPLAAV